MKFKILIAVLVASSMMCVRLESKKYFKTSSPAQLQITGDLIETNDQKKLFTARGHTLVKISYQDSKLEADDVEFNEKTQMVTAKGNVKILREGVLTTGQVYKFRITNPEYLITNPDTKTILDLHGVPLKELALRH